MNIGWNEYLEAMLATLLSRKFPVLHISRTDYVCNPLDFTKFQPGGKWIISKDFEAIAFVILEDRIKLHRSGFAKLASRHANAEEPSSRDLHFTFHQCLYRVVALLERYKGMPNRFMQQAMNDILIARIWSVLMSEASFRTWWTALLDDQKTFCMYQMRYAMVQNNGVTLPDPTNQNPQAQSAAPAAPQAQSESSWAAPQPTLVATGKRLATDEPDIDAVGPSSKRHAGTLSLQELLAQFDNLPSIPFGSYDGTSDIAPPVPPAVTQDDATGAEEYLGVAPSPLQEILKMGDDVLAA